MIKIFRKKIITVVDIGSYSLKAIQVKQNNNILKLISSKNIKFPKNTIVNGEIKEEKIVKEKLDILFKNLKYSPGMLVSTFPNNELIVRELKFPKMNPGDLDEAIRWNLEDHIPYSGEKAKSRYLIYDDNSDGKIRVLLFVIKKEVFNNYMVPFKELNCLPQVINIQPLALISLLKYQDSINYPVIILEMGNKCSRILIADSSNIYISRIINFGGNNVTKMIMNEYKIEFEDAEKNKINTGEKFIKTNLIKKLIKKELIPEILHSLQLYEVKNKQDKIQKLYLTGGGAQLKDLKLSLKNLLPLTCHTLLPFAGFEIGKDITKKMDYIICAGLAVSEVLNNES